MSQNPWLNSRKRTGAEYDAPYEKRAAAGANVHGEADFVMALLGDGSQSVLDAGCGTGRLGIELARRGHRVVGVDLDAVMLTQARAKAPDMVWHEADLATVQLETLFDCIVMAGNVMIYVTPGSEAAVVANMVAHLRLGGLLVTAFQRFSSPWSSLTLAMYDRLTDEAGLALQGRWSTWEKGDWSPDSRYVVSVHYKL